MRVFSHILTAAVALSLTACAGETKAPEVTSKVPAPSKTIAMLAVNDVYRIEGVDDGKRGGLGRIAWLRHRLEAETGAPVPLMHAGDFLSPSLYSLSNVGNFAGAEMVDVLNRMDGNAKAFDPLMFVDIGNHEFDNTRCQQGEGLKNFTDRVQESQFHWLSGNLDYSACKGADGLRNGPIHDAQIFTAGGIKFGIFGLTVDFEGNTPADKRHGPKISPDYAAYAKRLSAQLRAAGAEFVIGLTHLDWACDVALLQSLGKDGPDLIMGGHDHVQMAHFVPENPVPGQMFRAVYKASSDATDVAVYHFWRGADSKVHYRYDPVDMDFRVPEDKTVAADVKAWEKRLATKACANKAPDCLQTEVGKTAYAWALKEAENRENETRVGNWFTDLMREQADASGGFCAGNKGTVALINSGTFRLNYDVSKGQLLRREHVLATMPFGADLTELCVDASTLRAAVAQGLNAPGQGRYPHFSGMQVTYKRTTGKEADIISLKVNGQEVPAGATDKFLMVTGSYMAAGNDGYPFGDIQGDANRRKLHKDLAQIVPQRINDQSMTPAITDANRRKVHLPSAVDTMVPTCSAGGYAE
ncbi:bifunctional metallophosphatase/5'-nucleotidase [Kordiimonas marina]|uniref:bifunctional metallophosphatase/5'-nucleotidase n=1 Tax=Kordiimonas marina TaxID=2872312 RepID=UPI001FF5B755|nr:bifunctional metallophosphatase/5'-nucleotidase [Kordiimonas marina]MCJ9428029.1 bifunctional metallophosphatase/5'-nucleotidase [Kordiimonas marina]